MKLTVKDAARLLSVSEKSIYRWIKDGVIPAYQVNDQYRFNRAELLEWATSRKINVSPEIFKEPEGGDSPPPSLTEALRAGGVH
ncbi:MAG: helix-turn-helix domain-containing protein [Planctomycetia bacterium]|nr:helix-turn-helix domain-containing protein [Planctomycetia bacterium]